MSEKRSCRCMAPYKKKQWSNQFPLMLIFTRFYLVTCFMKLISISQTTGFQNQYSSHKYENFRMNRNILSHLNHIYPDNCIWSQRNFCITIKQLRYQTKPQSQVMFGIKNHHNENEKNTNPDYDGYNDDMFGLVFLSNLFVTNDYLFCIVFTFFSFAAVLWTKQYKTKTKVDDQNFDIPFIEKTQTKQDSMATMNDKTLYYGIPGIVVFLSFFGNIILNISLTSLSYSTITHTMSLSWAELPYNKMEWSASQFQEFIVCSISIIYAVIRAT